jgi:hypothetical protein
MTTWPHLSAKPKSDVLQEGLHAGSAGEAGFPSRGSRSAGGRASRIALTQTSCVKGGTHSRKRVCPTFYTWRDGQGCVAHNARREMQSVYFPHGSMFILSPTKSESPVTKSQNRARSLCKRWDTPAIKGGLVAKSRSYKSLLSPCTLALASWLYAEGCTGSPLACARAS